MLRSEFLRTLLLAVPSTFARQQQAPKTSALTLKDQFEATRQKYGLPALAGVTVTTKSVGEVTVTGVRKAETDAAATVDDKWHLGSDTKVMTATIIATLIEAGKLKWDTTLGEVFTEHNKTMRAELQRVTLLQLLSHRAGLPANVAWWEYKKHGTLPEQRLAVLRDILDKPLESEPPSKYAYSNLGYVLAGTVAEKITGQSWETLMQERIFSPLGMKSAGFGGLGTEGKIDQPWPHREDGKPTPKNGPEQDNAAVIGPAGSVHCSLGDWGLFIADQLRGAVGKGQLLKPESYQRLQTPPFEGDYCLGWMSLNRTWAKGKALTHAGSNTMNYAVAWLSPVRETGFLVCTNMGGNKAGNACNEATGHLLTAQFPNG